MMFWKASRFAMLFSGLIISSLRELRRRVEMKLPVQVIDLKDLFIFQKIVQYSILFYAFCFIPC